jgi:soluble lytic murein transglycosylase-like protein
MRRASSWIGNLALVVGLLGVCAAQEAQAQSASADQADSPVDSAPPVKLPSGLAEVASVQNLSQCVQHASDFHRVNAAVLAAILRHESKLRPDSVRRNKNGSIDAGIGQINSVHWPKFARHGIAPSDLLNPCVGTFAAAWHLSKQLHRWGNTWQAVGAYHSETPARNQRYQVLIWNELVDMGAVPGPKFRLPS